MSILSTFSRHVGADLGDKSSWQMAMKTAIRDPHKLCQVLGLPQALAERAVKESQQFPVFAPLQFVAKMRPGDPEDPLLLQVMPMAAEGDRVVGYSSDPVGDLQASLQPGLLQKYAGRSLLITTGACAIHCRYCFRRHFPYESVPKSPDDWQPALDRIAEDGSIDEVLLSGGDPLTLADAQLGGLIARIERVRHVRRLRIHSRLPIVIPQRVTTRLSDVLRGTRLRVVFVIHANHPRELDGPVEVAVERLVDCGSLLLNQAVLLRGVNDDVDVLEELCRRLVNNHVMPYYLHQLDPVQGAAHFEVPIQQGQRIVEQLRLRLPGYAVPRYVQEIPGEGGKQSLV
jgi:EF-P beta-lysylation protein EpmB